MRKTMTALAAALGACVAAPAIAQERLQTRYERVAGGPEAPIFGSPRWECRLDGRRVRLDTVRFMRRVYATRGLRPALRSETLVARIDLVEVDRGGTAASFTTRSGERDIPVAARGGTLAMWHPDGNQWALGFHGSPPTLQGWSTWRGRQFPLSGCRPA